MDARKYLPASQRDALDRYEATGRAVFAQRKRDGEIMVSLNGFRQIPAKEAIIKIREVA